MWLLPALSRIGTLALRTFYRFEMRGFEVPRSGPVLLVANHPNSIIDPGAVAAAARRPVRFLAKAPLFEYRFAGSLIRATGAIPVYRPKDDPGQKDKNAEMFRAVRDALAGGSAVGIFPEGMTHNLPGMVPLRTGAARIALGTAGLIGSTFPIVPIGLFFHRKETFRSRALALVGDPLAWDDLKGFGELDQNAVRELTRRIEEGLRAVTWNLERWEDAAAVETAAAIYGAEYSKKRGPEAYVQRLKNVSDGLRRMRERDPERIEPLFRSVLHFRDVLARVGLAPGDLSLNPRIGMAARWITRRALILLIGGPLAIAGRIIFYPPYALIAFLTDRFKLTPELKSTFKVLGGAVVYLVWILLLCSLLTWQFGLAAGTIGFVVLTLGAFATVLLYEKMQEDLEDARRFLLLRRRETLRERLLIRRAELAQELEELRLSL